MFQDTDSSHAQAIDNQGNIYGAHVNAKAGHVWRAYRRQPDGSITYFEAGPHYGSYFCAANEKKQAVLKLTPHESKDGKNSKYVLWDNTRHREFPSLYPGQRCFPQAMNDKAEIVGTCFRDDYTPMPVVWKNGKPALVKTPKIAGGSATGINRHGDIIGEIGYKYPFIDIPFLLHNGTFYELKDLLIHKADVRKPLQISDTGVILAKGDVENKTHYFLLKPR